MSPITPAIPDPPLVPPPLVEKANELYGYLEQSPDSVIEKLQVVR